MQAATIQIERAIHLPGAEGGEESEHILSSRHGLHAALRGITPSSAPPALAEAEPVFRNDMKSVAFLPAHEPRQAVEPASEPGGFFQENWLFVFPLAMFVLLATCAAILALA